MYEHKHSATHHRNLFDSIYMYLFYWHKFRVMSDKFGLFFYKNILNSLLSFIHMDFSPQRTLYLCLQITCLNRDVFFSFFLVYSIHTKMLLTWEQFSINTRVTWNINVCYTCCYFSSDRWLSRIAAISSTCRLLRPVSKVSTYLHICTHILTLYNDSFNNSISTLASE